MTATNKVKTQTNQETLPETGFIRLETLIKFIPLGRSTIWRKAKQGTFPKPIKLSANITAWRAEEVREWMSSKETEAA